MSYRDNMVLEVQKVSPRCFVCNKRFGRREYKPVHSGCGLHLELMRDYEPYRYVYLVTDPPLAYKFMDHRIIEVDEFKVFGFRYFADAVCVCHSCHRAIHALALELCRQAIPGFSGNTPTPRLLAEATFNFNLYPPLPAK